MECLNPEYCQSAINQTCNNCLNERFTKEELTILYRFLEHQHIPYDNYELILVVRKLSKIVDEE